MKNKMKSFQGVLLIAFLIIVPFAVVNFFGIGTAYSGIRMGYASHDGWRDWSADYTMLDGKMKHTIHPKDTQNTFRVEVVTEEGSISIEMTDTDGSVIFDGDNLQTSSFDVDVPGKVVVRIEADKHKGGFRIEPVEQQNQNAK